MLSILIRTYNDSVAELVLALNQQCQPLNIDYEILISDDNPVGNTIDKSEYIKFPNVTYWKNQTNLGRSNNLNKLVKKSKFDYILLLDNDVLPLRKSFIGTYLKMVKKNYKVVYGGLTYEVEFPKNSQRLRWLYGHKIESKSVQVRKEKFPYDILASNLLINKSVFQQPIFDTELTTYGYEDLIFSVKLKDNKIKVQQIDNPVIHKGLETSLEFLRKTEVALDNLIILIKKEKLSKNVTALSSLYFRLKKIRILKLFLISFQLIENRVKRNLISKHPSVFQFSLYKLYYFTKHF